MKILTKFLICLIPSVVMFILVTGGINYYFSINALNKLAETWLSGKLTEAMKILDGQERNLRRYDLEHILGSQIKAQVDAAKLFALIDMGNQGYIFVVDSRGVIKIHPDKHQIGVEISEEKWFQKIKSGESRIRFTPENSPHLAIAGYFQPWEWYVLAADPVDDYYGPANNIKPYILAIGCLGSVVFAFIISILVRRLMRPLKVLIKGAESIGSGNLHTAISVQSKDEFSLLSKAFNDMAQNLRKLTVSRNELESEIKQKEKAEKEREELIGRLKDALNKIRTLEGVIPICSNCKKIRDDKGYWNNLEGYIEKHSDALFSHGMCPECMDSLYGEKKWYRRYSNTSGK